jgi:simple sugar transport system permease protein
VTTNRPFWARLTNVRELGPFALLVILAIAFNVASPAFLSTMNVSNMLSYVPELGIMAVAMTLLMTAGEFDLSIGSVFGFCPVLLFILYNNHVLPFAGSFFVSLGVSLLIGFANGLLVAKVRLSSFITTIGTALIVRGAALYISNGFPQATWRTENWIKPMLIGTVAEVGEFTMLASILWFLGLAVVAHVVLKNLQVGNWILATGGNAKAARARGVNTGWTKIGLFVACAFLSGFAGTMDAIRVESAYPIAGTGYELEIIAMVVIGGTSLYGGRGTIIGTIIGVLLLRVIRNGIIVVGVPGLAYNIFVGGIIVIMMILHSLYGRRTRAAED